MAWPTKLAVLRTKAYAKIFNYHLSRSELHRFLITPKPLFITAKKLPSFSFTFPQLLFLRLILWVKLVALTGARAMNNSGSNDDIDLMVITAKNRLWLTRLLLTILLLPWLRRRLNFLQGPTLKDKSAKRSDLNGITNKLCLNLWLDETALNIKTRNLYTAHEVCQLKPLYDRDQTYQKFINANLWVKQYLANWTPEIEIRSDPNRNSPKQGLSLTGDPAEGRVGTAKLEGETLMDKLDSLFFKFQYLYMKPKITRERVSRHFAFFHPRPTGAIILKKYHKLTRIILVTGCFDILHFAHRKLLVAAKKLGGVLMVGVESDQRVRQLKGSGRPLNFINQRIDNLEKLNLADIVFPLPEKFNTLKDFRALINQIKPEILAVSASTPNLKVKRKIMAEIHGRVVVVLPHNPKISTTKMLKSIK